MLHFEAVPKALGREIPRGIAGHAECLGDRRPQQRITQRVEHQRERALGDVMSIVASRQLGDQGTDRIEDRIERVAVAGQDHPRRERAGAFLAERIEALIDDHAGIGLSGASALDGDRDARRDRVGDRLDQLSLKARGGAEMVEQISMGSANLAGDGFQRHRLRTVFQQQLARGSQGGRAAFLRA